MILVTAIRILVISGVYVEITLLNPTFPSLHLQFSQNCSLCGLSRLSLYTVLQYKDLYYLCLQKY